MKLKKIALLGLAALTTLTLVACGSSSKDSQAAIKEKGKLVVAISPDYAPFEFQSLVNGKNKIVGADVELAQDIADELGVELELSSMNFNNVLTSLTSGKADIAISGLSYTKERAKVYDFSDVYYETENAILVRKSELDKYTSLDDLAGKKVAALKGAIEETLAKEQLTDSNIVGLTAMGEAINELKSGHVDAVTLEAPVAAGYIAKNDDIALAKVALKVEDGDAKAIAMPKGSDELKKTINKVIEKVKSEDKYKTYIEEAAKLTEAE